LSEESETSFEALTFASDFRENFPWSLAASVRSTKRYDSSVRSGGVRNYNALTGHLEKCDEPVVTITFSQLDDLVGGLPNSARKYQAWWTNSASSQPHSRSWLNAHRLATPDFNAGHVVFTTGSPRVGVGTKRVPKRSSPEKEPVTPFTPTGDALRGEVAFEWMGAGSVSLVAGGLRMPVLGDVPGVYRFSLMDYAGTLTRSYVGEGMNLSRRMNGYRSPGPTQSTNVRLNALLRATLEAGGSVVVAVVLTAMFMGSALDLTQHPARLLIENAALVQLGSTGAALENL
jgi:hypothetical protein